MGKVSFEDFLFNSCQTIKRIRKEKGLTQEVVAKRIKAPQSMVARFESGNINDAHISLLFRMCDAIEEDIAAVISQAVSTSIVNQAEVGNDLNSRWLVLKEKFALLKNPLKKELLEIVERIFKVIQ